MSTESNLSTIEKVGAFLIRFRWPVIVLSILLAIGAGMGAQKIVFKNDYRIFFSEDNPQLQAFEELQDIYTKEDNIQFVLSRPEGNVYTPHFLEAVEWLTAEAWKLPFATRVDSLTNFQHSEAVEDDLYVDDLVTDPESVDETELEKIRSVALADPLLYNRVVGDNEYITAVNATLTLPEKDATEAMVAANAARDVRDRFNEIFPDIGVYLTGVAMLNNAFGESSMNDMSSLVPLMYLGIIVTMIILLRSFAGTFGTLLVIIFSSATAIGLMGWIGLPMTAPVTSAPTMIMTLAVADSIHYLVTLLHLMRSGKTKREAIIESLRINFTPIFLTSVTTAIGFLSMNLSDVPPFRHLGNIVAMGVMAAWFYSVFFLPALIAVLPLRVKTREEREYGFFDSFANLVISKRRPLLWGSLAVVAVLASFIPRLEFNDQFVNYFSKSVEFRNDTDYTMEHLTGIYSLQYSLESGESGGISEPEYLHTIDDFSEWFREQKGVMQVVTLSDVMKRLNKNMHGDDPAYYSIPDDRELAAQYLLLYEMSLPYGLDLNNQINVDKSATRLTVTMENLATKDVKKLIEDADAWLVANAPEHMQTEAASPMVMFTYISERNVKSMFTGAVLALILISALLAFALRSPRYGLVSLIPNLVPAALGFGAWTLLVGEMGLSLSTVMGMTLGIVVDDTVHFLSKYLRARREHGLDAEDSIRFVFQRVGKALFVTTIILVVGFGILSFSSFRLNAWMGLLTAIVITFALIADFLLLPSVLLKLDGKKREKPIPIASPFTTKQNLLTPGCIYHQAKTIPILSNHE